MPHPSGYTNITIVTEAFQLLIFSKPPRHGQVKTRMQPELSPAQSVRLHRQLLEHTLMQCIELDAARISLWTPDKASRYLKALSQRRGIPLEHQLGSNLGQRMSRAIKQMACRHAQPVLLIGADCPFMTPDYLVDALAALKRQDIVIGPANDGGFVLLGANQPLPPRSLDGIAWGTADVLKQTLQQLKKAGAGYCLLPALDDIDRPEDLDLVNPIPLHRMRWLFGVQ